MTQNITRKKKFRIYNFLLEFEISIHHNFLNNFITIFPRDFSIDFGLMVPAPSNKMSSTFKLLDRKAKIDLNIYYLNY